MLINTLSLLAIALYLAAAGAMARPLVSERAPMTRLAMGLALIALVAHGWVVFAMHGGKLDFHFFAALSLAAWVIAALTWMVNLSRPVAALGVVVFPLAALFLGIDRFLAPPSHAISLGWQIKLHVTVALLAFGVLSIAAIVAIGLALQEHALRRGHFSRWLRALPPLTLTESLLFRLIHAGFTLLTLTLFTGIVFVHNIFAQHLLQKTVLSILAWLVFGALLWGRWRYGWRGIRAVNLTLVGMAVLVLAFFGSKLLLEMVLHRSLG